MSEGPIAEYRRMVSAGKLNPDPVQALAVEKLQSLHQALKGYQPSLGLKGWKDRFGLSRRREDPPLGIYLYGGVGRGKSLVMDMFFQCAPIERKRRVHFHSFMQQVHRRLEELRKSAKHADDPIPHLARLFADEAWLLCFDEFQVLDIADAMILGRLFESLFAAGVVMVVTTNRPPADLYKDGLQRELFLPFIDLISDKLDILELDGSKDYRLEMMRSVNVYLTPDDLDANHQLGLMFQRFTSGAVDKPEKVVVQGRRVELPMAGDGVAMASFADLCERPLGPADYLEIAGRYHTMFLQSIPRLGPEKRNEAKRFVTLIDALYDHRVNLVCSASAPPGELYVAGSGAFEFQRTASRLIEMQSEDYMKEPHKRGAMYGG